MPIKVTKDKYTKEDLVNCTDPAQRKLIQNYLCYLRHRQQHNEAKRISANRRYAKMKLENSPLYQYKKEYQRAYVNAHKQTNCTTTVC